jgi:hypothetical protein
MPSEAHLNSRLEKLGKDEGQWAQLRIEKLEWQKKVNRREQVQAARTK